MNTNRFFRRLAILVIPAVALTLACGTEDTATVPDATATTPAAETEAMSYPTPDSSGLYRFTTIDQARQIVPFPVVVPEPMPVQFEMTGVLAQAALNLATPGVFDYALPEIVTITFAMLDGKTPPPGIQLIQTPIGDGESPELWAATITIEDLGTRSITKTVGTNGSGTPLVIYSWKQQGINLQLVSVVGSDVTEEDLAQLVAAIPDRP